MKGASAASAEAFGRMDGRWRSLGCRSITRRPTSDRPRPRPPIRPSCHPAPRRSNRRSLITSDRDRAIETNVYHLRRCASPSRVVDRDISKIKNAPRQGALGRAPKDALEPQNSSRGCHRPGPALRDGLLRPPLEKLRSVSIAAVFSRPEFKTEKSQKKASAKDGGQIRRGHDSDSKPAGPGLRASRSSPLLSPAAFYFWNRLTGPWLRGPRGPEGSHLA